MLRCAAQSKLNTIKFAEKVIKIPMCHERLSVFVLI